MKIDTRWFGIDVFAFKGTSPPRVWAIYLRIGRKRKIEVVWK